MVRETEFYDRLHVAPTASAEEIRRAYRKMALRLHPDRNRDDPKAEDKFKAIGEAYDVLSDPERRAAYDRSGQAGLAESSTRARPAADVFTAFFGASAFADVFGADNQHNVFNTDIVTTLGVTLQDLYHGTTRRVVITRTVKCRRCAGSAHFQGTHGASLCTACNGSGRTTTARTAGMFEYTGEAMCTACKGTGHADTSPLLCPGCRGKHWVPVRTKLTVNIEPGMRDGHRIVQKGAGDESQFGQEHDGDAVFVVKTESHPLFTRAGADLRMAKVLTLEEALGARGSITFAFEHPSGRVVAATTPEEHVMTPGETMLLDGLGMPVWKKPHQHGNLLVVFEVRFPLYREVAPRLRAIRSALGGAQEAPVCAGEVPVPAVGHDNAVFATLREPTSADARQSTEAYDSDDEQDFHGSTFDSSKCAQQ